MFTLYERIQKIRERPGLYLGEASISKLRAYLEGYQAALRDCDIPKTEQEEEFYQFHEWVRQYYNFSESTSGWNNMILARSSDEAQALEIFFDLFDQFLEQQKQKKAKQKIISGGV